MKSIFGRKMGMTQMFAADGTCYPVTVVEVLPNVVTQVKTIEKDGYEAIQIGYEEKKENRCNKAEKGIFAAANTTPKYELTELKGDEMKKYKVGDLVTVDLFKVGDMIDVSGISKGKGFSGAIKRFHYTIGPKGHGSGFHRQVGSLATNGRTNNRIHPGEKMPGHQGNYNRTILNLIVVGVDKEKNALLIKGPIPGATKSLVTVRSAIKVQHGKPQIVKPLASYKAAAPAEAK